MNQDCFAAVFRQQGMRLAKTPFCVGNFAMDPRLRGDDTMCFLLFA